MGRDPEMVSWTVFAIHSGCLTASLAVSSACDELVLAYPASLDHCGASCVPGGLSHRLAWCGVSGNECLGNFC